MEKKFSDAELTAIENIKYFLAINKQTDRFLAASIGMSPGGLCNALTMRSRMSFNYFEKVAEHFHVPLHALFVKKSESELANQTQAPPLEDDSRTEHIAVPLIDNVKASLYGETFKGKIRDWKFYPAEYLKQYVDPIQVKVKGNSMFPYILDGDLLLIDRNLKHRTAPPDDRFYLVNAATNSTEIEAVVKRVTYDPESKTLHVISTNVKHKSFYIKVGKRKMQDIILGIVVRIERELTI